jgi:PAS domain S-box-containing protein
MSLKFKATPALIIFVVIFTVLLTWLVGYVTEREIRTAFLQQTQIGANTIDVKRLGNLTGTTADLKSPDYLYIKQQLARIRKVDKNLYFVYLMGLKNERVFFYVDDRPDGHPEGSPPGSPYDEAPKEFTQVMKTGIPTVEGPSADSWGSYVSGCVPVVDSKTGKVVAIFAIDFVTSSWYWRIISHSALPIALVVLLMLLILSSRVSRWRAKLLKNNEERYRLMFDNNPQPNWIYDNQTLAFLEVNDAAIKHYGYSRAEFLSMTIKDICPDEDVPLLLNDISNPDKSYRKAGEWRHVRKNGDILYIEIVSHSILFEEKEATHILVNDITERKKAEEALYQSDLQLRKFASHLQNVREEEKIALAREIHDDLGQILVALKIDMGLLKQKVIRTNIAITEQVKVLSKFDNVIGLIDRTIKTARRIMNGLRPELLEIHGFEGATREYLREFEERHHVVCEFTCGIERNDLSDQQSLIFFRILQEALSNIAKHSKASLVKIKFTKETDILTFEVCDNGVGFDINSSGRQDSYGILGMKERIVLLQGKLDIVSEIGEGTCIRVEVPYHVEKKKLIGY